MMPTVIRPLPRQKRNETAKIVFPGKLFDVWQREQKVYTWEIKTFEWVTRPDTVLVIPILDNWQAVFGIETQPGMKEMMRTLGWRLEKWETAEDAAHRELMEESWYTAKELRLWDARQPLNKIDWAVYLFVAHWISKKQDTNLDDWEKIKTCSFPITELLNPDNTIPFDDNEFLFKLYYAQANKKEKERVMRLLTP